MSLGERIKTILVERKLKQTEFATALGISANYVNLLVNGKKTSISDTLAKLIEETYGYSANWVLKEQGEKLITNDFNEQKEKIIKQINKMSDAEINAVLAFVNSLESLKNI